MTEKDVKNGEKTVKEMNIYERLSAITDELGVVAKNLNVVLGSNAYKAVGERDILDAVKPLEKKYRVYSYPSSRVLESFENERFVGKVVFRVETTYKFVNIDNPEDFIEITSYGDGVDTQDKAPGKAMTYADKYALMKAYKISTGEDPDQEASPEDKPAASKKESGAVVQEIKLITAEQIEKIKGLIDESRIKRMLAAYKKKTIEELQESDAAAIIKRLEKEKAKKE